MTELLEYAAAENAKKVAWMEEGEKLGEARWTGLIPEDQEYFDRLGVSTVAEYELQMDKNTYSDMYKEVYGIRPIFDTSDWTDEQWREEIDIIAEHLQIENERQREYEKEALARFEKRVADTIEFGARDVEQALKWIFQAEGFSEYDLMYGESYVCYQFGLNSQIAKEVFPFDKICKEMLENKEYEVE